MKKTIILILALLPIVLLIVIAFAGQVLSIYQHIPVERVEFIDRFGNPYTDEFTFSITQGDTKPTSILIYPELASNKRVTYKSANEAICTIDGDGVITAHHYGNTTVIVTTDDGNKVAVMNVRVKADVPYSVTLSADSLSMITGEIYQLDAVVDAPVAVNKDVTYESSDPSVVKVDATGKLVAVSEGTAEITVTTVSGGLTDTCTVTVTEGVVPISFDFDAIEGVSLVNGVYEVSVAEVDLASCLRVGESISIDDVMIKLQSGSAAHLDGGTLTFSKAGSLVTVRAYVGSESNPDYMAEIKLVYKGK